MKTGRAGLATRDAAAVLLEIGTGVTITRLGAAPVSPAVARRRRVVSLHLCGLGVQEALACGGALRSRIADGREHVSLSCRALRLHNRPGTRSAEEARRQSQALIAAARRVTEARYDRASMGAIAEIATPRLMWPPPPRPLRRGKPKRSKQGRARWHCDKAGSARDGRRRRLCKDSRPFRAGPACSSKGPP